MRITNAQSKRDLDLVSKRSLGWGSRIIRGAGFSALGLCLTLSSACSANRPLAASAPTGSTQTTQNTPLAQLGLNAGSQTNLTLNERVQAALASYHEIDASFAETQRLAGGPGFKTQLLGLDIVDQILDHEDDSDSEPNQQQSQNNSGLIGNVVEGVTDLVEDVVDSTTEVIDTDLNVDVNLGVGVNLNADNQGSGHNQSTQGSQTVASQAHAAQQTLPPALPSTVPSAVPVQANQNQLNLALSAQALAETFDQTSYDRARLQQDLNNRLQTEAMRRQVVAASAPAWQNVSTDTLQRLKGRGITSMMTQSANRTNADGSVTSQFGVRFKLAGSEREVWIANLTRADVLVETQYVLKETGQSWSREAARLSERSDNGLLRTMTVAKTRFANQEELEIVEDRYLEGSGNGIGRGSFRLGGSQGDQGELRTKIMADGTLSTFLNSEKSPDLLLREDTAGQLSFSTRQEGADWTQTWKNLDLKASTDLLLRV